MSVFVTLAKDPKMAKLPLDKIGIFDHRGIIVSIEKDDTGPSEMFVARAGGRSVITMSWTGNNSMAKVIKVSQQRIDENYEHNSDKIALWRNDSTHWRTENPNVIPPEILTVRGMAAMLEEVIKNITHGSISTAIRDRAVFMIERAKKET